MLNEIITINGKEYKLTEYIGGGAFGKVYKADFFNYETGKKESKTIKIATGKFDHLLSEKEIAYSLKGTECAGFENSEIVKQEGVTNTHYLLAVMPDYGEGTQDLLKKRPSKTPEQCKVASQVAKQIQLMWDKEFYHLDLKRANVLIDPNGNAHVCDFGLALKEESDFSFRGTSPYLAPEMLNDEDSLETYNQKQAIDTFSLFITLLEMYEGKRIYRLTLEKANTPKETQQNRSKWGTIGYKNLETYLDSVDCKIPANLKSIFLKGLHPNPSERTGALEELIDLTDLKMEPTTNEVTDTELSNILVESNDLSLEDKIIQVDGEKYKLKKLIGKGSVGRVFSAKYFNPETSKLEDKTIKIATIPEGGDIADLEKENEIASLLRGTECAGFERSQVKVDNTILLAVMPFYGDTTIDLNKELNKGDESIFQRDDAWAASMTAAKAKESVALQISQQVETMRIQKICHLDLKPGNILLAFEKNEEGKIIAVKAHLCDFGDAVQKDEISGYAGTLPLMSPEMMRRKINIDSGDAEGESINGNEVDTFSHFLTLLTFFEDEDMRSVIIKITKEMTKREDDYETNRVNWETKGYRNLTRHLREGGSSKIPANLKPIFKQGLHPTASERTGALEALITALSS